MVGEDMGLGLMGAKGLMGEVVGSGVVAVVVVVFIGEMIDFELNTGGLKDGLDGSLIGFTSGADRGIL